MLEAQAESPGSTGELPSGDRGLRVLHRWPICRFSWHSCCGFKRQGKMPSHLFPLSPGHRFADVHSAGGGEGRSRAIPGTADPLPSPGPWGCSLGGSDSGGSREPRNRSILFALTAKMHHPSLEWPVAARTRKMSHPECCPFQGFWVRPVVALPWGSGAGRAAN